MVGRIIVTNYCDPHWFRDGKEENAEFSSILTINGKTYEMEWCEACNNEERTLEGTLQLFVSFGRRPETRGQTQTTQQQVNKRDKLNRPGSLICPDCGARYSKQNYFNAHLELHKDDPNLPFPCDVEGCDRVGSRGWGTQQALGFHKWRAHGIPGVNHQKKK